MFFNETKTIYQPFVVGERVETKIVRGPLTGSWIPARVEAVDSQCQTLELCLLNNERYQVKKKASRVPASSVRRIKSRFKIGDSVVTKISRGKIKGIWIPARIIAENNDGTYDLYVEEYETWQVPQYSKSVFRGNLKSVIKTTPISNVSQIIQGRFNNQLLIPSKELLDKPKIDRNLRESEQSKRRRSRSVPLTTNGQSNNQPPSLSRGPLGSPQIDEDFKMKVKNKERHTRSKTSKKWRIKRSNSRVSKLGRSLSQRSPSLTPRSIFSSFQLFGSSQGSSQSETGKPSRQSVSWSRSLFSIRKSKSSKSPAPRNKPEDLEEKKTRITVQRSLSVPLSTKSPAPVRCTVSDPQLSRHPQNITVVHGWDSPSMSRPETPANWLTPVTLDNVDLDDENYNEQSLTPRSNTHSMSNWDDLYEWPNEEDELKQGSEDGVHGIMLEDLQEENEEDVSGIVVSNDEEDEEEDVVNEHLIPHFSNEWTEAGWSDALSRLPERPSIISPLNCLVEDLEPNLPDEQPTSHPQDEQRTSHRQDESPYVHRQKQSSISSRKTMSTKNWTDNTSAMVSSPCETSFSEDINHSLQEYAESPKAMFIDRKRNTEPHHGRISTVGVSKHKIQFSELDIDTPLSQIASWLGEDSRRRMGNGHDKNRHPVRTFSYNNTTIPISNEVPFQRSRSQPLSEEQPVYSLGDVLGQKSFDASKGLAFFVGPVDGKMSYKVSICDVDKINRMSRSNSVYRDPLSESVLRMPDENEVSGHGLKSKPGALTKKYEEDSAKRIQILRSRSL